MPPTNRPISGLTRVQRDSMTISIVGELDAARDGELLDLVINLDPLPGTTVRLDLGEVTVVDSRGLDSILRTEAYLRGRRSELVVERPQSQVRRLLDVVGFGNLVVDHVETEGVEFSRPT